MQKDVKNVHNLLDKILKSFCFTPWSKISVINDWDDYGMTMVLSWYNPITIP
jgi:hypothetical protein